MSILKIRTAVSDMRSEVDYARPVLFRNRVFQCLLERHHIVPISADYLHIPVISLESFCPVLAKRQARITVDGNMCVIINNNQLAQSQMSRKRAGLGWDAF